MLSTYCIVSPTPAHVELLRPFWLNEVPKSSNQQTFVEGTDIVKHITELCSPETRACFLSRQILEDQCGHWFQSSQWEHEAYREHVVAYKAKTQQRKCRFVLLRTFKTTPIHLWRPLPLIRFVFPVVEVVNNFGAFTITNWLMKKSST